MTPQVLWFVLVGYCSLKYKNVRMWFMMISTLFPFVGVSLSSPSAEGAYTDAISFSVSPSSQPPKNTSGTNGASTS